MQGLLNIMRAQAMRAAGSRSNPRFGLVSSYDPSSYCVKVLLQPEDTETGWLPLASPWVGAGWGLFAPPSVGDQIEVGFQEGDPEAGYACLRFFNDEDRPLPCPSGEFWLVHKSGSFLKFTNDGDVLVATARDLVATVGRNAALAVEGALQTSATVWNHTGPVNVTGLMTVGGIVSTGASQPAGATFVGDVSVTGGDVKADTISLKTHHTSGVQPGSGTSGGPVP